MSQPLSPSAQAVDTALADCIQLQGEIIRARPLAAAALRAAVAKTKQRQYGTCWICDANEILAIASELDGANPTNQEG